MRLAAAAAAEAAACAGLDEGVRGGGRTGAPANGGGAPGADRDGAVDAGAAVGIDVFVPSGRNVDRSGAEGLNMITVASGSKLGSFGSMSALSGVGPPKGCSGIRLRLRSRGCGCGGGGGGDGAAAFAGSARGATGMVAVGRSRSSSGCLRGTLRPMRSRSAAKAPADS